MEYSQSDFLKQLNSQVIDLLSGGAKISDVIQKLNSGEISFNAYRDYVAVNSKDFLWLPEFKKAVNAIRTIIENPKIHLRTDKVLLNVDIASKVDTLGINMTVKEPRHWKRKENGEGIAPEYVYANIYEDELPIYENRFLCLLINKMYVFLSAKLTSLYAKTGSLDKYVDKQGVGINDIETIKSYAYFYKVNDELMFDDSLPLLTPTDNKVKEYIEQLTELKISLNKIRKTYFYKTCMKAKVMLDTEVKPTNVLTMHYDYRTCYEFYKALIKYVEKEHKSFLSGKDYQNYVILTVLSSLQEMGYKVKKDSRASIENNRIILKDFEMLQNPISFSINTEDNKVIFNVSLIYKDNKFIKSLHLRGKRTAKYVLEISPNLKYTFFDRQRMNSYINDELNEAIKQGASNYFIISPFTNVTHDNAIMVTPHSRKLDKNISNLLKSFIVFIEGDEFIYSRKCPVCSSFLIDFNSIDYECLNCNTTYSIMKIGNKEINNKRDMVWLKRIGTHANIEKKIIDSEV